MASLSSSRHARPQRRRSSLTLPSNRAAATAAFAERNIVIHFNPNNAESGEAPLVSAPNLHAIRTALGQLPLMEYYSIYATTPDAPDEELVDLGQVIRDRVFPERPHWYPPGPDQRVVNTPINAVTDRILALLQPHISQLARRRAAMTEVLADQTLLPTDLVRFGVAPYVGFSYLRRPSSRSRY